MNANYIKKSQIILYLILINLICLKSFSQKYTEPDKIKQFNVTVNYDDFTVKTQMLRYKNFKL